MINPEIVLHPVVYEKREAEKKREHEQKLAHCLREQIVGEFNCTNRSLNGCPFKAGKAENTVCEARSCLWALACVR